MLFIGSWTLVLDHGTCLGYVQTEAVALAAVLEHPKATLEKFTLNTKLPLGGLRNGLLDVLNLQGQGLNAEDLVLLSAGIKGSAKLPKVCRLGNNKVIQFYRSPNPRYFMYSDTHDNRYHKYTI